MHTSTVTVAVVDTELKEVKYKDSDFRIEWFSGTGAGGQHRNKHQNSCRYIHIPTGIIAVAQCRSRQDSLTQAKKSLLEILDKENFITQKKEQSTDRKIQVGSGMRGDKIRTYRFQDDIVADHKTGKQSSIKHVMRGNFDILW